MPHLWPFSILFFACLSFSIFVEKQKLKASDGHNFDTFGRSVFISSDYAIIGSKKEDEQAKNAGAAYIFKRNNNNESNYDNNSWKEHQKIMASDGEEEDYFGRAVAISSEFAVVGSVTEDEKGPSAGAAYVFKYDLNNDSWVEIQKLTASDGERYSRFGNSVAISNKFIIVGSHNKEREVDGVVIENAGECYIFEYNGTRWEEKQILTSFDGTVEQDDKLGFSSYITQDFAIAGAYTKDTVYVYKNNGTGWMNHQKLIPSDYSTSSYSHFFGISVFILDDLAIIGASNDSEKGATYIFKKNGTVWEEKQKLIASDGKNGDEFGISVSLTGDYAIVGSKENDGKGATYVFKKTGSIWKEIQKLIASDGDDGDTFGMTVAASGNYVIVAAYYEDGDGNNSSNEGAAYIFKNVITCNGDENGCGNSTQGFCISTNICSCKDGWRGNEPNNCTAYDCFLRNNCSGHGSCLGPNRCECKEDWYGLNCNDYYCDEYEHKNSLVCSGRGSCTSPGVCECNGDYFGDFCQDWYCGNFKSQESGVCNSGGECIEPNICNCLKENYTEKEIGQSVICVYFNYDDIDDINDEKSEDFSIYLLYAVIIAFSILCFCIVIVIVVSAFFIFLLRKRKKEKDIKEWEGHLNDNTNSKELVEFEKNLYDEFSSPLKPLKKKITKSEEETKKFFEGVTSLLSFQEKYLLKDVSIEIGRIIDHGAKGVVRDAVYYLKNEEGEKKGIKVAVKQMKIGDDLGKSEIIRETKTLCSLQNIQQVVRCYGCFFQGDNGYVILEKCFSNLKDFIKKYLKDRKSSQDELFVLNLLISIAEGINNLHKKGIIHRDLKTENILFTDNFKIRICDFEASRSFSSYNASLRGTVHNIPPEVVDCYIKKGNDSKGKKKIEFDQSKGDVYAFAFVIFEFYSKEDFIKRIMEEEKSSISAILRIRKEKLRPNLNSLKNAPKGIKELIQKCWEENPKTRKSMTEVLEELKIIKKHFLIKEIERRKIGKIESFSNGVTI